MRFYNFEFDFQILVLERGNVLEYDDPTVLLAKPEGEGAMFRSMIDSLGETMAATMRVN